MKIKKQQITTNFKPKIIDNLQLSNTTTLQSIRRRKSVLVLFNSGPAYFYIQYFSWLQFLGQTKVLLSVVLEQTKF